MCYSFEKKGREGSVSYNRLARRLVRLLLPLLIPIASWAQTTYTWNGSASNAWNTAANWTPATGFPTAADHAIIVSGANPTRLDMARSITNITVNSGTLDLNGFTLTSTGDGNFTGGVVNNGTFAANSASGSMTFGATTFGAAISGTASAVRFTGATFNGAVNISKTGSSFDYSTGTNTFNAAATFTVTNGRLYLANTGATTFNGNVVVNSTGSSGGVWMGQNTGTLVLAAGYTITAGTFNVGSLLFRNFTQLGATAQVISLSGTATLYYQVGTTFNAAVTSVSPGLYFTGTTFNGSTKFTKTGIGNEYSGGGNIFNGTAEFVVTGTGTLYPANTGIDTYNGNLLVNSTNSGGIVFGQGTGSSTLAAGGLLQVGTTGYTDGPLRLRDFNFPGTTPQSLVLGASAAYTQSGSTSFGGNLSVTAGSIYLHGGTVNGNATYTKTGTTHDWGSGGCVFNGTLELINQNTGIIGPCNTGADAYNGDIIVSNTSSGSIRFGNGGGVGTLAAGRTLTVGSGGYADGLFLLDNFIQAGTTPQNIVLGPNALIYIRSDCEFNGALSITAGGHYLDGGTFNGPSLFTKTGSSSEGSSGGNTFNAPVEFLITGSGGLHLANGGVDTYHEDIVVGATGTGQLRFGNGGGTSILAPGKTITVGPSGFSGPILLFRHFDQQGNTPQVLNTSDNTTLYFYQNCSFGGPLTAVAGSIQTREATFAGDCHFTNTNASSAVSPGGNVFNGRLEIVNSGTGIVYLGEALPDNYNGDVRFNNLSTGQIRIGNSAGGGGVLAAGRTLAIGTGGFNAGLLLLRDFVQLGNTTQNILLTGTARCYFYPGTVFNGPLTAEASDYLITNATFRDQVKLTRWGAASDNCNNSTFDGPLELVNNGTGGFYMGDATGDTYNGNITISNTSSGTIRWGNAGGLNTLPVGRTISLGSGGFDTGSLYFTGFTQLDPMPINLPLGVGALFQVRAGCTFHAPLDVTAGDLYLAGSTFNRTVRFEKTGTGVNSSAGGNTFQREVELWNSSTGHIFMAGSFVDNYNGDLIVNNLANGSIRFSDNGVAGSIMAAGNTIRVGSGGFAAGLLRFTNFQQAGIVPVDLPLGNTTSLHFLSGNAFGGDVFGNCGSLLLNGTTFNGRSRFVKNDNTGDQSAGGCIFQGDVELTNNGTGYIMLDNTQPDLFNGDIILNNTTTGSFYFGHTLGSATLADGHVIRVGAGGFDAGLLQLRNFTQVGPTPQALTLGNGANLTFQVGTTFNGDVVSTSGRLHFHGATFNGTGTFTKTNNNGDASTAGNTFNGRTEFIQTGAGHLSLAQNAGTDQYNGDIVLNNTLNGQISFGAVAGNSILASGRTITVGSLGYSAGHLLLRNFTQVGPTPQVLALGDLAGLDYSMGNTFNGDITSTSGRLYFNGTTFQGNGHFTKTGSSGDGSTGNNVFNGRTEFVVTSSGHLALDQNAPDLFNGDVYVNSTSTGRISFGQNLGTATLATGRIITVGSLGFNTGTLVFKDFTQIGGTAQNLLLGSGATLLFMTGNTFNGNITTSSGTLQLNGTTFNGNARFTKTGTSGDACAGGNIFNGTTEFINTNSGHLSLDQNGFDAFNGDVLLNNTSNGQISFGQSSGSATLAAGRTMSVGSLGFNAGTLAIRQFTQVGATPQTLMLGATANLYFQTASFFDGNMTASAGNMFLNGTTFNGTGWFRKTGASNNSCTGGNLFAGNTELITTGAGIWYMANTGNDVYAGDVLLNSTGTGGINFGNSTGTTMVSAGSLGIGSVGFSAGNFVFRNFTKQSATATTLVASTVNNGITFAANTTINGNLTATAGNLWWNGTTFNGDVVFSKTNTGGNSSTGGNVFNGDVVINNAGQITMATSAVDDFNGDATFRRTGAGTFIVGNTHHTTFSKNVSTVGSTGGSVQFGAAAGRTIFDGTTVQTFSSDAATPPSVRNMTLAMTGAGELQLLGNVNVTVDMAFTSGLIRPMAATSTSNGLLILANGSTISVPAHAGSYVDGFVRKIGNTAFSFPVGNAGVLAPINISAPAVNTHHFTAKYVYDDSHLTYPHMGHDATLDHMSRCEYWILDRTNSTTNVNVTLSFENDRSCGVTNLTDLVVARWNGTMWKDHGNGGTTGNVTAGTVMTAGPVTAFSPFTLASRTAMNPLPIELISFDAVNDGDDVRVDWRTATELDNDRFEVERSADGTDFEHIATVAGAGTSHTMLHYTHYDQRPLGGTSYYRLKQVDLDGTFTYSDVVAVRRELLQAGVHAWPNPVTNVLSFSVEANTEPASVKVMDAAGRVVLERSITDQTGTMTLDLVDVQAGALFLTVTMKDGSVVQQRLLKL